MLAAGVLLIPNALDVARIKDETSPSDVSRDSRCA
jgi:hypothetical protein